MIAMRHDNGSGGGGGGGRVVVATMKVVGSGDNKGEVV